MLSGIKLTVIKCHFSECRGANNRIDIKYSFITSAQNARKKFYKTFHLN